MGSWIAFACRPVSVAAAAIPVSISAVAQDSCAALKAISQATDAFASLRGERLPSGGWRARFTPAGFTGCTVEESKGDAVVLCSNSFIETDQPATLINPIVEKFKECVGSGWKVRRAGGTGEELSVAVIYNESPVEFEVHLAKERSGVANAMGLTGGAWRYRVSLKAFTPSRDARPPSLGFRDPAAFCTTLKALLVAAPDAFKAVKGKQSSEHRWQSTLVLQGLKNCRVAQLRTTGTTYFTCEAEFESRSALAVAQRQLASESVTCLGSEWSFSRRPRGDGVWSYSVERKKEGPNVEIWGRSDDGKFALKFDVDPE